MVASINLSNLNGKTGFTIIGVREDAPTIGFPILQVSEAGDINGDGIDDLIIGNPLADPKGLNSGQSYVVFGRRNGLRPTFNLTKLNGQNGFIINGIRGSDRLGNSVSNAGDINGDGIDDLVIGSSFADASGGTGAGKSYVIFGKRGNFGKNFNLSKLNGRNGFAINGTAVFDELGESVSSAGDINGDGIGDLIVGARSANAGGQTGAGKSYVVFGKRGGFTSNFNLSRLNGSNGFVINGIAEFDFSGSSVSGAGDINGDGIDDLVIGARSASPNGAFSGQSYVVFGSSSGFGASLNLSSLNGSNGFAINGASVSGGLGAAVSDAGDINGDGIDDLIIGSGSTKSYVIFGSRDSFNATFDLSTLDGNNGFVISASSATDFLSLVSGAGDINGDGVDDLIIGTDSDFDGKSYVVFGSRNGFGDTLNLSTLNGRNGFAINGIAGTDPIAASVSGAGDINGDGVDDLIIASRLEDFRRSYVIYGGATYGTTGRDTLNGNARANVIYGFAGNDRLSGGARNDTLLGGDGNDVLLGDTSNDYLVGEVGTDKLTGGLGGDRFIFDIGRNFRAGLMGVDSITDFRRNQGDMIVLNTTTFAALTGKSLNFESVGTVAQAATSRALITYIRQTGALFYNPNRNQAGFGSGGQFADLQNGLNLVASDFVIQA
jgi:Ca2+-binding RTX toxin-like protein